MSRRRRTSLADELFEVTSRVPWWVGIALAVSSYLLLHWIAGRPLNFDPKAPSFVGIVMRGVATAGQYLLPIIFLAGALGSALARHRAKSLLVEARSRTPLAAIDGMSWAQFEALVGEVFREMGYRVVETGGGGADGGVDLVMTKDGEKFLVQCKQWRAFKVGVGVVRELYGVMSARGAVGGFVVTSGTFTDDAKAFAEGRNVHLVDGRRVEAWIRRRRDAAPTPAPTPPAAPSTPTAAATPSCPSCGAAMIKREARRGANAGGLFWGCTTYPTCRGTRPIP
ncbi:MAG TPA: restriction endonuclease [Burkholderiaceae bacterium]|nr:restriction endonuclease [Burkholderiaceae bacterium]